MENKKYKVVIAQSGKLDVKEKKKYILQQFKYREYAENFSKKIKKGYTQEQLAEKLGVTNKTISRWENRHYMPDLSLLEPLSKELDITLNELLAGEEIVKELNEWLMEMAKMNNLIFVNYYATMTFPGTDK